MGYTETSTYDYTLTIKIGKLVGCDDQFVSELKSLFEKKVKELILNNGGAQLYEIILTAV